MVAGRQHLTSTIYHYQDDIKMNYRSKVVSLGQNYTKRLTSRKKTKSYIVEMKLKTRGLHKYNIFPSKILGYRDPIYKHENPSEQAKVR